MAPGTTIARALLPLALVTLLLGVGCGGDSGDDKAATTAATQQGTSTGASGSEAASPSQAACRPGAKTTPEQTEGPYYKSGPPRRSSLLERGIEGRHLHLAGRVLTPDCRPLAGARVDFWQADGNGVYDNDGYRLRGYQVTNGRGRYSLETVVPGRYEARAPHIHVKVTPKGGQTVTTQLYMPGEAENASDPIYQSEAVIRLRRDSSPWRGSFDFVVEPG